MFRYVATNLADQQTAIASLKTGDPNEVADLKIMGKASVDLKFALKGAYGPFGHLFNVEETSAIDLHYALSTLNGWTVESAGTHEVTTYDPDIPEGAMT